MWECRKYIYTMSVFWILYTMDSLTAQKYSRTNAYQKSLKTLYSYLLNLWSTLHEKKYLYFIYVTKNMPSECFFPISQAPTADKLILTCSTEYWLLMSLNFAYQSCQNCYLLWLYKFVLQIDHITRNATMPQNQVFNVLPKYITNIQIWDKRHCWFHVYMNIHISSIK